MGSDEVSQSTDPSGQGGKVTRLTAIFGGHRRAFIAGSVALVCVMGLVAGLLVGLSGNGKQQVSTSPRVTTTTLPGQSPGSTAPATTSPPASVPQPWPLHSTPALYPSYLPPGVTSGSLVIDSWSAPTLSGYVQSYYGTTPRGLSLPELVIAGADAERMFSTSGKTPEQSVMAGYPVSIWRIVSQEQAEAIHDAAVTGVTATVAGRPVSLLGVSLSDAELATVLSGLRPRSGGPGWNTGALPASLVLVAEGTRTEDQTYRPYRIVFPHVTLSVTHDVVIPRGACVCNAESWPVQLTTVGSARAALIDMMPTDQSAQTNQIEWQYSPDAEVTLTFSGISTQEALRMAASVQTAPLSRWTSLPCTQTVTGVGEVACNAQKEIPTIG